MKPLLAQKNRNAPFTMKEIETVYYKNKKDFPYLVVLNVETFDIWADFWIENDNSRITQEIMQYMPDLSGGLDHIEIFFAPREGDNTHDWVNEFWVIDRGVKRGSQLFHNSFVVVLDEYATENKIFHIVGMDKWK